MKLFQSERRLNRELSRILTAPQEKVRYAERRAQEDEEDFLVYLPSDLEIDNFHHYQIRDEGEVLLRL